MAFNKFLKNLKNHIILQKTRIITLLISAISLNYILWKSTVPYYFFGHNDSYLPYFLLISTAIVCVLYTAFSPKSKVQPSKNLYIIPYLGSFITLLSKLALCFYPLVAVISIIFPRIYTLVNTSGFMFDFLFISPALPMFISNLVKNNILTLAITILIFSIVLLFTYSLIKKYKNAKILYTYTLKFIILYNSVYASSYWIWTAYHSTYISVSPTLAKNMLEMFLALLATNIYVPFLLFLIKLLELSLHEIINKIISYVDSNRLQNITIGYNNSFLNKFIIGAIALISMLVLIINIIGPIFSYQTLTIQIGPWWASMIPYEKWYLRGDKIYLLDKYCLEDCVSHKIQIPLPSDIRPKKLIPIRTYYRDYSSDYANTEYILLQTKNNEYYLFGANISKDDSTNQITIYRLLVPLPPELVPIRLYIKNNNTIVGKLNSKTNSRYIYKLKVYYPGSKKNSNNPEISIVNLNYQLIPLAPANFSIMKQYKLSFPNINTHVKTQSNKIEYPFYNNCILAPNMPKISYSDYTITVRWYDPYLPKENNKETSNTGGQYYNAYLKFYWGQTAKQRNSTPSSLRGATYLVWSRGESPILGIEQDTKAHTYIYTEIKQNDDNTLPFINTIRPSINPNPRWLAICHDSDIKTCNAVVGSLPLPSTDYYYLPVECDIILKDLK